MTRIAFIGAGRMASAMVSGLLRRKVYPPEQIGCTCGEDPTGQQLAERCGITYFETARDLINEAEILVLACKPQQFSSLDPALTEHSHSRLVISILAGMPIARLHERFPHARNIVRAMPNTPGQIGHGVTAYASWQALMPEDDKDVRAILGSLGTVLSLPEAQLDAVTAVSGSGPAYVFEFTAALRDAALKEGLPFQVADILARETIAGAALLLRDSGRDPAELRDAVRSPGGTTEAALESFKADHFEAIVERAVRAAAKRSLELAKA